MKLYVIVHASVFVLRKAISLPLKGEKDVRSWL
jgi:hypothetical protein